MRNAAEQEKETWATAYIRLTLGALHFVGLRALGNGIRTKKRVWDAKSR